MQKPLRYLILFIGMASGHFAAADGTTAFSTVGCTVPFLAVNSSTGLITSPAPRRRYRISTDSFHFVSTPSGNVDPSRSHTLSRGWQITTWQRLGDNELRLAGDIWHIRGSHFFERCSSRAWVEMPERYTSQDGC